MEVLNLETIMMPESRQIVIPAKPMAGILPLKRGQITLTIPPMSMRVKYQLTSQYMRVCYLSAQLNPDNLPKQGYQMLEDAVYDTILTALKPGNPWITKRWLKKHLPESGLEQVYKFVVQPIEDQLLKNLEALKAMTPAK